MFQTVIFDLDGTILDTLEDLANAGNKVCQQNGWPEHSMEEFRGFIGHGIHSLVKQVAPDSANRPLLVGTAVHQFCNYYETHKQDRSMPYAGIVELLEQLKEAGITLGVYSNKTHSFCDDLVTYFFPNTFMAVQGKLPDVPIKPDSMGTNQVIEALGADPTTTLFVGDGTVDVETARNAGLSSCVVTWGFRSREELIAAKPDYVVESPSDILKIVLG